MVTLRKAKIYKDMTYSKGIEVCYSTKQIQNSQKLGLTAAEAKNSESGDEVKNSESDKACIGNMSNTANKTGIVLSPVTATQNEFMEYFKKQARIER